MSSPGARAVAFPSPTNSTTPVESTSSAVSSTRIFSADVMFCPVLQLSSWSHPSALQAYTMFGFTGFTRMPLTE